MAENHKKILLKNRVFIVQNVDLINTFLWDALVSEGVISNIQVDSIKCRHFSNHQQVSALISHLERRPFSDFQQFLAILREYDHEHVADRLSGQSPAPTSPTASTEPPVPQGQPLTPSAPPPQPVIQGGPVTQVTDSADSARSQGAVQQSPNINRETFDSAETESRQSQNQVTAVTDAVENLQVAGVVQCTKQFYEQHMNSKKCYPVSTSPKGVALIVNITEVHEASGEIKERSGCKTDRKLMVDLFKALDYQVCQYEDVDPEKFRGALDKFVKKAVNMKASSIFMVLMSHGGTRKNKQFICLKDGTRFFVRETIEKYFSSRAAGALAKIPKVFIIQACQGDSADTGVKIEERLFECQQDATAEPPTQQSPPGPFERVASFQDYFFANATQPNMAAHRDTCYGSWFIHAINDVFRKKAATHHIAELFIEVRDIVRARESEKGTLQFPESTDGLSKTFYIFPGIPEQTGLHTNR